MNAAQIHNAPKHAPDLGVYVLSFNGAHILQQYLPSVLDQGHVVVVDNGSTDGTREAVLAQWPAVTIVSLPQNVGLGAALNAAVMAVPARNIVLMNNDVGVLENALRKLSALLDSDSSIGLAAPKLLNPDGSLQAFGNDLGLTGLPAIPRRPTVPLFETFFQAGCVTAMRRDEFLALGGYTEFFEWFYEDVDVAWKYRNVGLRVVVDSRSSCIHFLGATLGHASRERNRSASSNSAACRRMYYSTRNVLLMFAQDAPWYQALLQLPFVAARQCTEALAALAAGDTAMAQAYVNAWRDAVKLVPQALARPTAAQDRRWKRTSTLAFVQIEFGKALHRLLELGLAAYRSRRARP